MALRRGELAPADEGLRRQAVLFLVHHGLVKSSLFLIGGIAGRVSGSQELSAMGGIVELSLGVSVLFLVAAFSLAGMPPFSGFFAKFVLIRAGLAGGHGVVVLVALVTSLLTLYSMSKIWNYAFWRALRFRRPRAATAR